MAPARFWQEGRRNGPAPDGPLTATGTFTTPGGTMPGVDLALTKDTIAPGAPTFSPAAGTYATPQSVNAVAPEAGAVVRFTRDLSPPGADSSVFRDPLDVAGALSVKAVAVDAAGNVGPAASADYTIVPARPAVAPATSRAPAALPRPSQPVAPAGVTALRLRTRQSMRSVRSRGLMVSIEIAGAPQRVRFVLMRRRDGALRAAGSVTRVFKASGFARMRLPARALGLTHKGRYVLRAGPGSIAFAVR